MINDSEISDTVPYAGALVKLLQGVVYSDEEKYWGTIVLYKGHIARYFSPISIEFVLNEQEGFAFLRQKGNDSDEKDDGIPRLIRKRALSYEQTLLSVMLREWIEEFDTRTTEGAKLFVTQRDIRERIEVFFKDSTNRSRLQKQLNACIDQATNVLGILKRNKEDEIEPDNTQYEVKRIIKAMINNYVLEEILHKLNEHAIADERK